MEGSLKQGGAQARRGDPHCPATTRTLLSDPPSPGTELSTAEDGQPAAQQPAYRRARERGWGDGHARQRSKAWETGQAGVAIGGAACRPVWPGTW